MFGCNFGCSCNHNYDYNYDRDMGREWDRGCYPMDWKIRKAYWAGYQNGYGHGCYDAPFCHRNIGRCDEE